MFYLIHNKGTINFGVEASVICIILRGNTAHNYVVRNVIPKKYHLDPAPLKPRLSGLLRPLCSASYRSLIANQINRQAPTSRNRPGSAARAQLDPTSAIFSYSRLMLHCSRAAAPLNALQPELDQLSLFFFLSV